jgi:hypothetical protein
MYSKATADEFCLYRREGDSSWLKAFKMAELRDIAQKQSVEPVSNG